MANTAARKPEETPSLRIVSDSRELALAAAETFTRCCEETLRQQETAAVALSGGSTPRQFLSLLAENASFSERMPWDQIHCFQVDERHVPPDHPDSNFRMLREALFRPAQVPRQQIHRIRAEEDDPQSAADAYERDLKNFFRLRPKQLPRFDCVVLGMGADGHTASIFPGSGALRERERLVVTERIEALQAFRITLSLPVINNAASVIVLASGGEKAAALAAVFEGRNSRSDLPAQRIRPAQGTVLWIVDRAAAAQLRGKK